MDFTRERTEEGVTERLFDLTVAGETVPGVIWAPQGARGPRPLVLCLDRVQAERVFGDMPNG